MPSASDFEHLVPETMLTAVERVVGEPMSGVARSLPSYINRVYEVQTMRGDALIAKFYRPGRWSIEALNDEHLFVRDCAGDEIPVIAPLEYNGTTIHEAEGLYFALFPKRYGRPLEITSVKDWVRLGHLLGRVHNVGARREAAHRTNLHPAESTEAHIVHLLEGGFVTPRHGAAFETVADDILDRITELFDDVEFIRIHGDCHGGNILKRPGEGMMMIDFDDMMVGPPVQDIWLLLPDRADRCQTEINLLRRGYEQFREFDPSTLRLIEPLRAMRIIYFLAWCSTQVNDYRFRTLYPDWGSDAFWQQEVADLTAQSRIIAEHLDT